MNEHGRHETTILLILLYIIILLLIDLCYDCHVHA